MKRYLVTWIENNGTIRKLHWCGKSPKDIRKELMDIPYYQTRLTKFKSIKLDNNNLVLLDNTENYQGQLDFPRLQANKRGHIILALSKSGILTTGILVGKTKNCEDNLTGIGTFLTDWEVCGDLTDYSGPVTITFENEVQFLKNLSVKV